MKVFKTLLSLVLVFTLLVIPLQLPDLMPFISSVYAQNGFIPQIGEDNSPPFNDNPGFTDTYGVDPGQGQGGLFSLGRELGEYAGGIMNSFLNAGAGPAADVYSVIGTLAPNIRPQIPSPSLGCDPRYLDPACFTGGGSPTGLNPVGPQGYGNPQTFPQVTPPYRSFSSILDRITGYNQSQSRQGRAGYGSQGAGAYPQQGYGAQQAGQFGAQQQPGGYGAAQQQGYPEGYGGAQQAGRGGGLQGMAQNPCGVPNYGGGQQANLGSGQQQAGGQQQPGGGLMGNQQGGGNTMVPGGYYGAEGKWATQFGSTGIDIFAPQGTPVLAPFDGKIVPGPTGMPLLQGTNGIYMRLVHVTPNVQIGQQVKKGQQVATIADPMLNAAYQHADVAFSRNPNGWQTNGPAGPGGMGGDIDARQMLQQLGIQQRVISGATGGVMAMQRGIDPPGSAHIDGQVGRGMGAGGGLMGNMMNPMAGSGSMGNGMFPGLGMMPGTSGMMPGGGGFPGGPFPGFPGFMIFNLLVKPAYAQPFGFNPFSMGMPGPMGMPGFGGGMMNPMMGMMNPMMAMMMNPMMGMGMMGIPGLGGGFPGIPGGGFPGGGGFGGFPGAQGFGANGGGYGGYPGNYGGGGYPGAGANMFAGPMMAGLGGPGAALAGQGGGPCGVAGGIPGYGGGNAANAAQIAQQRLAQGGGFQDTQQYNQQVPAGFNVNQPGSQQAGSNQNQPTDLSQFQSIYQAVPNSGQYPGLVINRQDTEETNQISAACQATDANSVTVGGKRIVSPTCTMNISQRCNTTPSHVGNNAVDFSTACGQSVYAPVTAVYSKHTDTLGNSYCQFTSEAGTFAIYNLTPTNCNGGQIQQGQIIGTVTSNSNFENGQCAVHLEAVPHGLSNSNPFCSR
jgi:murein DD-endopeptidase MepM/ murein hydrolase activator NlpD